MSHNFKINRGDNRPWPTWRFPFSGVGSDFELTVKPPGLPSIYLLASRSELTVTEIDGSTCDVAWPITSSVSKTKLGLNLACPYIIRRLVVDGEEEAKDDGTITAVEGAVDPILAQVVATGPQGPVGVPKGAWDNATLWKIGDVVTHNNSLWQALRDNTNVEPTGAHTADWLLLIAGINGVNLATDVGSSVLIGANGGTGVANTGKTITLAGNLTTTGAFNTTFAQAASITVTLPGTSATMARTDATQTFTGNQGFLGKVSVGAGSFPGPTIYVHGSASTTAFQVEGVAAGLYVDFNGGGDNYYDATIHHYRSGNSTATFATISSSGLTVGDAGVGLTPGTSPTLISLDSTYSITPGDHGKIRLLDVYGYELGVSAGSFDLMVPVSAAFNFYVNHASVAGITYQGAIFASSYVKSGSFTVATLPAASVGAGARAFVTDANATTFMSTVAGGGANKVPVVSDGTNWLIG